MKQLVYILLFFGFGLNAQIHVPYPKVITTTNSYITYLTSSGGGRPAALVVYAISNFINAETAAGDWGNISRLWVFGQDNTSNAVIDLTNKVAATLVNSPTFTAYQGYKGNGTSMYINSNFPLSSTSQNSTSYGVFKRSNVSESSVVDMGIFISSIPNYSQLNGNQGGVTYMYVNETSGSNYISIATAPTGKVFFVGQRTGASATALWNNGTQVGTGTTTSASVSSTYTYFIMARDANNATATQWNGSDQFSLAFIGNGTLSQTKLWNSVNNLATALGW